MISDAAIRLADNLLEISGFFRKRYRLKTIGEFKHIYPTDEEFIGRVDRLIRFQSMFMEWIRVQSLPRPIWEDANGNVIHDQRLLEELRHVNEQWRLIEQEGPCVPQWWLELPEKHPDKARHAISINGGYRASRWDVQLLEETLEDILESERRANIENPARPRAQWVTAYITDLRNQLAMEYALRDAIEGEYLDQPQ